MGSVRTTGTYQTDPSQYWTYGRGGNIALAMKGSLYSGTDPNQWDALNDVNGDGTLYAWSASYGQNSGNPGQIGTNPAAGIATLAGGDVSIRTGGSFSGQSGTFGAGNFSLDAGGDIKDAHFLVKDGTGMLNAMGNIGNFDGSDYLVIDAFAARLNLAAQGNIALGTVLNPTVIRKTRPGETIPWSLQYGTDSSVSLAAATGDVTIYGTQQQNTFSGAAAVLPGTLQVHAGRDINLGAQQLILAPSPSGDLRLTAGRDINGTRADNNQLSSHLYMSDMDPARVYGDQPDVFLDQLATSHSAIPVHKDDTRPVVIKAETGDIKNLQLYFPKQAQITAGAAINNIYYSGQNLSARDFSEIVAGGNISFSDDPKKANSDNNGIDQAGPGYLLVQAGDSINLGATRGINSNGNYFPSGNTYNPALGNEGASLIVVAGTRQSLAPNDVRDFFGIHEKHKDKNGDYTDYTTVVTGLWDYGNEYTDFKSSDPAKAAEALKEARASIQKFFFGDGSTGAINDGKGNISMTSSQISTLSGKSDIFIAARSQVDVGRSTFNQKSAGSGITTTTGGAVYAFSGGDYNVNESRSMTYQGGTTGDMGDVTVWSDQGDINAGRGSRTSVNASPPKLVSEDPSNPNSPKNLVFTPPAVGSGIRAVSYSPDGIQPAPPPGNIFLFAPNGKIDAGEAGIAGGKIVLGAIQVVNPGLISSLVSSPTVPSSSEGTTSINALGGSGAMSAAGSAMEQSSAIGQAASKLGPSADLAEDFIAKWLDVKVLSFDEDESPQRTQDSGK
jgi:hypothetical protein